MIGVYTRVSSRSQRDDSQRAEISKWLKANGIEASSVSWYADQMTGTTLARPEFERLQADVFSGNIKTVVVWKLDRLSRRLRDGVNILADWCEKGLKVVIITQQIEMSGAVGRMIAAVLLGLAEIEWEFRRERQMAGVEVAKQRGVYKGRQQGTTKAKPERAKALREKGLSAAEISQAMGLSERTVWRYLMAA